MDEDRLDLTRPRRVGELLATTLRLFFAHAGLFLSVTLLVVAPVTILIDGVWGRMLWDGPRTEHGLQGTTAAFVTALLIPPLVTGLHAVIVRSLGEGVVPHVGGALRTAAPRFPAAVGAVAIYGIGVAIGTVLLVVPGMWLAVRWYFGAQAAVLDRASPDDAIDRSAALVKGRFWSTAGALLASAVLFGSGAALANVGARHVHDGAAYVSLLTVIQAISLSLTALFGTLLFFSLRASQAEAATALTVA